MLWQMIDPSFSGDKNWAQTHPQALVAVNIAGFVRMLAYWSFTMMYLKAAKTMPLVMEGGDVQDIRVRDRY